MSEVRSHAATNRSGVPAKALFSTPFGGMSFLVLIVDADVKT